VRHAGDDCTYVEPSEPMKAMRFWTILADPRWTGRHLPRAKNNPSVGKPPFRYSTAGYAKRRSRCLPGDYQARRAPPNHE
jgi:hypothetical protein